MGDGILFRNIHSFYCRDIAGCDHSLRLDCRKTKGGSSRTGPYLLLEESDEVFGPPMPIMPLAVNRFGERSDEGEPCDHGVPKKYHLALTMPAAIK